MTPTLFLLWALGALPYAAWRVPTLGWAAKRFQAALEMKGARPARARWAGSLLAALFLIGYAVAWPIMLPLGLLFRHQLHDEP